MVGTVFEVQETLISIKDYIRWGASRFSEAGLFFGQGTGNALDDSAAVVLHSLNLPYQLPDLYLDAKLTQDERNKILNLFERRVNEKIPSAYLTKEAIFADLSFYVDSRVLIPRSPIAELIKDQFSPWVDAEQVHSLLDLCTGSACIAIAAAYAFPDAQIDAADYSQDALDVARINVDKHNLQNRVNLICTDLFSQIEPKKYDLIVSNPPYVSISEWQKLPKEFHAEPELGFKGGDTGLDIVIRLLANASQFLSQNGILVVEVGSSAECLQALFSEIPFYWLDFEHGGDGVFLLTADQVMQYQELFNKVLN